MAQGGERVGLRLRGRGAALDPAAHRRHPRAPRGGGAGPGMGFYAFAEDITDRVRAQEELHRQHDQLAHASRVSTLGEMATALAHELNQPLTAVLSNANAVLRLHAPPRGSLPGRGRGDPPRHRRRRHPRRRDHPAAARARPQGRFPQDAPRRQPGHPRGGGAHPRRRPRERRRPSSWTWPRARHVGVGDAIQVQQVVLNLVRNAIDAMRALPKPERRLVVRSLRERDAIVVSVEDSGPPIEKEALDQPVRAVLHHQAQRPRHGPLHQPLDHRGPWRRDRGAFPQRARPRRALHAAGHRGGGRRRRSPDERMKARGTGRVPRRSGQGLPRGRRAVGAAGLDPPAPRRRAGGGQLPLAEALLAEVSPARAAPPAWWRTCRCPA